MKNFKVPVGVSNRHVHLSKEDMEIIFGLNYNLTKVKDLSQPGEFTSEEMVTLKGPRGYLEKVRVLGPTRKKTQVELTVTDSFKLGVEAVVRDSGNHEETPGIIIIGPLGEVNLESGTIVAARHLHMNPEEAQTYDLKDKEYVQIAVEGARGGIFDKVLVRVSPNFVLDFHIDTDEANAFGIKNGQMLEVIS